MWCSNCHQDVPGVANPTSRRLVCSRCQHPMAKGKPAPVAAVCDDGIDLTGQVAPVKSASPPIRTDDWSARRRVRELDRALRRPMHIAPANADVKNPGSRRFDPPQNLFDALGPAPPPAITLAEPPITSVKQLQARRSNGGQVFSWLVVLAGVITLAAGVGLIGWSLYAGDLAHWNLALGLALSGQGELILGLVLVVSRLWRNSRFATSKLQEVHARLGQLQQTADVLTSMRTGGASAFYADLARGASPQMLLGNLKGQLDQLAAQLGTR